jgi:hypothetical protein
MPLAQARGNRLAFGIEPARPSPLLAVRAIQSSTQALDVTRQTHQDSVALAGSVTQPDTSPKEVRETPRLWPGESATTGDASLAVPTACASVTDAATPHRAD